MTYNGYANYETWNASLWIANDRLIYHTARNCYSYQNFVREMKGMGSTETGDGVRWDSVEIDDDEMDEVLAEL